MSELINIDPIADEINRLHGDNLTAVRMTIERATRIGELLETQKEKCARGEWLLWLKENIHFSQKTANNYRSVYRNRAKLVTVTNLDLNDAYKLLTEGADELVEPEVEQPESVESEQQSDNDDQTPEPEPPAKPKRTRSKKPKKKTETRKERIARHRRRVELNGIPELLDAFDNDEIAPAMAETIANLPSFFQAGKLAKEKKVYARKKARSPQQTSEEIVEVRTGKPVKSEEYVPNTLTRQIIAPSMVGKGFRACNDVNKDPCQLSPNVSELEFQERAAFAIGGFTSFNHRKAHAKWERYEEKRIRERVIEILASMSPMRIPPVHRAGPIKYEYDVEVSSDLRELVEMLNADLLRAVETLELQKIWAFKV